MIRAITIAILLLLTACANERQAMAIDRATHATGAAIRIEAKLLGLRSGFARDAIRAGLVPYEGPDPDILLKAPYTVSKDGMVKLVVTIDDKGTGERLFSIAKSQKICLPADAKARSGAIVQALSDLYKKVDEPVYDAMYQIRSF